VTWSSWSSWAKGGIIAGVDLPDFPDLSPERLAAVLTALGLTGAPVVRLAEVGIFNAIFAVRDDLVLRVPRQHPAFVEASRKEALAVPAARSAGVRTPRLVAFDDTLEVLPVPYSLDERVPGGVLEAAEAEPTAAAEVYRELGRDLGRLHGGVERSGALAEFELEGLPEPDQGPEELVDSGHLGRSEQRWLSAWVARLKARIAAGPERPDVFRHGDVQATNVMVSDGHGYLALLDWGACGWGDPAHDFAGVPFAGAPAMLAGYREERDLPADGSIEAAIVLRELQIALFLLRRPGQPGRSWAERPLGMMLDLLHGLAHATDATFAALRP